MFNLQEVQLPASAGADTAEQVRTLLGSGKPMEDVAALLKLKDIKFGGGAATRAAEQIPLELLTKVHALKDGQSMVVQNPQGFNVIRVASSQSAPVPEANALPRIEQFLANQRGAEAVSQAVKDLRAKATITYMGDFAGGRRRAGSSTSSRSSPGTRSGGRRAGRTRRGRQTGRCRRHPERDRKRPGQAEISHPTSAAHPHDPAP